MRSLQGSSGTARAPLVRGGKAAMFGGAEVGETVLIMELIRSTVAPAFI